MSVSFKPQVMQFFCRHQFRLDDLKKTGIPEPEKPPNGSSVDDWNKYHRDCYEGDHHTKRVVWPCAKCGKVFYAHCGLDISPKYGPIIPSHNTSRNGAASRPLGDTGSAGTEGANQ